MQEFANERSLAPYFDGAIEAIAVQPSGASDFPVAPAGDDNSRPFDALKRMLDSVGGLGWSVIGFILGATFWHFIGFWAFVSDVVLAGGAVPTTHQATMHQAVNVPAPGVRQQWLEVADAAVPSCTTLHLDRRTGLTTERACEADHAPLPQDSFEGREDRIVAAHPPVAAQDTLRPGDRLP